MRFTQKNFNGGFWHVIMAVEFFAVFFGQFLDDIAAVGVEEVDEGFEDVQMEGGCD